MLFRLLRRLVDTEIFVILACPESDAREFVKIINNLGDRVYLFTGFPDDPLHSMSQCYI